MNSLEKKTFPGAEARFWLPALLTAGLLTFWFATRLIAGQPATPGLTAHEWGTFTAIAGTDGHAMKWTPLTVPDDLPNFVEHLSNANFKLGLRGTIRMETPVLYFYSPGDVTVSVNVAFSKGVLTEWYPHASHVEPVGIQPDTNLSALRNDGRITWSDVAISPTFTSEFPRQDSSNRYYAARATSSAPLRVESSAGEDQEKFLFYRGVSAASLPLSAKRGSRGQLLIKNLGEDEIPAVIRFERRGEQVSYSLQLKPPDETALDAPALNSSIDALCGDLERILTDQGLYPDEAHAMVETWRDSWFEEGSRLIYIVPRGYIDKTVPLAIEPAPSEIVRVFVGRMEIVTPATVKAVQTAMRSHDEMTLSKYGRFLEPILQIAKQEHSRLIATNRSGR